MSRFQRFKSFFVGVIMLLFALIMLLISEDDYDIIATIIAVSMIIYGLRLLVYYRSMARHMVGGKIILYEAIIILDLGLFTITLANMASYTILLYLLITFAFTGAVDILRAFEAKKNGSSWKRKLLTGVATILFAVLMTVLSVAFKDKQILLYGYCISLTYSAVIRIVTAFRKTAIVYIQ